MIDVNRVSRRFQVGRNEHVDALTDVSFSVREGEMAALLGPNGAGKSTVLRVLTALVPPTSGTATVAGYSVVDAPAKVRGAVGFVGQGNGAAHGQRVDDELLAQGRAYGLSRAESRERCAELLELLDLTGVAGRHVRSLSGGQRRRVDIALGLVPRPPLLFLDEPTTGLDPHHRANLWEHVSRLRAALGTTILLTTHYLEEADAHAERILVIDGGRIVADDTAEELKRRHVGHRVRLTFEDADQARKAEGAAGELTGTRDIRVYGNRVDFRADRGDDDGPGLLRSLDAVDVRTRALTLQPPTLDDVFLELTGRSLREGGQRPGPVEP